RVRGARRALHRSRRAGRDRGAPLVGGAARARAAARLRDPQRGRRAGDERTAPRAPRMIRVAAVGDLHVSADSAGLWRDALAPVSTSADLLLIAGDLTRSGSRADAEALLVALDPIEIPTVAVLGNHDYHERQESHLVAVLERHGVDVLEGCGVIHEVGGMAVGVAGTKGFGGGFEGASGSEFGEPE